MKKNLILAIGSGAGAAVSDYSSEHADVVAVNTDRMALEALRHPEIKLFQVGSKRTKGLSCAGSKEAAITSIEEEEQTLKELINQYEHVVVMSCLGGGMGSYGIGKLLSYVKELGKEATILMTTPFRWEGASRAERALEMFFTLKRQENRLLIFPAENVAAIAKKKGKIYQLNRIFELMNGCMTDALDALFVAGLATADLNAINIELCDASSDQIYHSLRLRHLLKVESV